MKNSIEWLNARSETSSWTRLLFQCTRISSDLWSTSIPSDQDYIIFPPQFLLLARIGNLSLHCSRILFKLDHFVRYSEPQNDQRRRRRKTNMVSPILTSIVKVFPWLDRTGFQNANYIRRLCSNLDDIRFSIDDLSLFLLHLRHGTFVIDVSFPMMRFLCCIAMILWK